MKCVGRVSPAHLRWCKNSTYSASLDSKCQQHARRRVECVEKSIHKTTYTWHVTWRVFLLYSFIYIQHLDMIKGHFLTQHRYDKHTKTLFWGHVPYPWRKTRFSKPQMKYGIRSVMLINQSNQQEKNNTKIYFALHTRAPRALLINMKQRWSRDESNEDSPVSADAHACWIITYILFVQVIC